MLIFTLATLSAIAAATQDSNCKEVSFTLSGIAANRNITGIPLNESLSAIIDFYNHARTIATTGTQLIRGTFCDASKRNDNNAKLQVLFHSITTDRTAWSALGGVGSEYEAYKPEKYSWVRYSMRILRGIRLSRSIGWGMGNQHIRILCLLFKRHMTLYHDLAMHIRAGDAQLPSPYTHLIYIGNSYGSQLGASIAGTYPKAYNEYILTGFTNTPQKGFGGVGLVQAMPAQTVDPLRFANFSAGYLTTASKEGRTNAFFGSKAQVDYEDTVADLFFERKDVVSIGQFVTIYAFPFDGARFKGRVLVLDGEQDQPYCGPGSPVIGLAECGRQPKDSGVLFPDADYNYQTVDRIGHAVQARIRSPVLFDIAHRFLAGKNFSSMTPV
ncbi:hypothetical protein M409DRAFT_52059 [Zasmidium cellare ATCC 36951]|uniref:AB hydrolase-1 domain-containing protein n=1 Tax=Zasmidium cellare ATCC 36951 TaxID=1080233 RepID=A0A6A6CTK9_ZASCE|nr:uncharacterized protein M409DRAFT_52059 [Zasmidium cellare ATCC 36951]KAF2169518.1 hypothetical protein M409DRAFT_52059 [Zasmidium cellare ATCC 36951]